MYLHIHTTINYQFTYVFSENIFNIYSYDDFKHFLQWWLFSNSDQQLLGHPRYRSEKIRTYSNEIFQWKKNWHTFVTKWNFLVPKKNCILDFSSQQNNVNFVEDHTGRLISHVQWVLKKVSSILHLILPISVWETNFFKHSPKWRVDWNKYSPKWNWVRHIWRVTFFLNSPTNTK